MLVAEVPDVLERMGIGAFLSPQSLPASGRVLVLDLAHGVAHETTVAEATREVEGRGNPIAPRGVRPCIDDSSPIRGLAYVMPALVEGTSAQLLLDTGALRTDVLAQSHVGKGLLPRSVSAHEAVYAASGKLVTRTVFQAHVRLGDFSMKADVDVVEGTSDQVCPRDGVIAMDALRQCVLVLGPVEAFGRCSATVKAAL
jgi:hypothetical protein